MNRRKQTLAEIGEQVRKMQKDGIGLVDQVRIIALGYPGLDVHELVGVLVPLGLKKATIKAQTRRIRGLEDARKQLPNVSTADARTWIEAYMQVLPAFEQDALMASVLGKRGRRPA